MIRVGGFLLGRRGNMCAFLPRRAPVLHMQGIRGIVDSGRGAGSLLLEYKDKVASDELEYSDDQFKVLRYLSRLSDYMETTPRPVIHEPEPEPEPERGREPEKEGEKDDSHAPPFSEETVKGATEKQPAIREVAAEQVVPMVKGLYIHGGVGVGKTMLMDLFFANCRVDPMLKRRVHLHNFLLEIHARIHRFKQQLLSTHGRDVHIDLDPRKDAISQVARQVADETWLLAFDEFEVTNVADALILSKFFRVLWERGTVVVATSNRHPTDLYKHGLNRQYFLPFLDLLQHHSIVREVRGADFRAKMPPCAERKSHYADEQALQSAFSALCEAEAEVDATRGGVEVVRGAEVPISNSATRTLRVPVCAVRTGAGAEGTEGTEGGTLLRPGQGVAACLAFADLCVRGERGAADFQALADHFPTVCLSDVPQLSVMRHDQARRFVVLVDILYDAHTRLLWGSEHGAYRLFRYLEAEAEAEAEAEETQWVTPSFSLVSGTGTGTGPGPEAQAQTQGPAAADGTYAPKNLRGAEQLSRTWRLRERGGDGEGEGGRARAQGRAGLSDSCVQPTQALLQPPPPAPSEQPHTQEDTLMVLEGEVSSVRELLFAFRRASSRLQEMQGRDYLDLWEQRQRHGHGHGHQKQ